MAEPWINYHHLLYFKVIAEEGSVSKAAKKLLVGQPTLSAQLKQLEDSLGLQLFERQHKKLILTEQGQVALNYAKTIFNMGSEMYEVLHDRIKPLKPSVHIGALDSIPKQVILSLVQAAFKISSCQITLSEGKPDELLRELASHRIDLVLSNFIPSGLDGRGLSHRVITKKNVAIYGAPKFKHLRKDFPRSISGQPMIVPSYASRLRYDLDDWSKKNDVQFDIITESQDIAVKKLMSVDGMGLMASAGYAVSRQVQNGELVEIGQLKGVNEELVLVTAIRKIENGVAKKLMSQFSL